MPRVENVSRTIQLFYTDREINSILSQIGSDSSPFTKHYNQSEELFLKLKESFTVPALPIHHDVKNPYPTRDYVVKIRELISTLVQHAPSVFKDLTYLFEPTEILKPNFFKIYRINGENYLYLVKIDLLFRARDDEIITQGSNDTTPSYRTNHLFLEANLIPLAHIELDGGKVKAFHIKQTISQTWIGERGRGYFVQGIWIDDDLTKFFSKLFLPQGKRTYPYYPFICKYKTVCLNIIDFSATGRKQQLPYLHRAIQFLLPEMERIQNALKNADFSENLPIFKELKSRVPPALSQPWENLNIEVYLNEEDMKEFKVDI